VKEGQTWKSDPKAMRETLTTDFPNVRTNVRKLFTDVFDWEGMSNHTVVEGHPAKANSLETTHDGMHLKIGGNGHMANVPVAGFDPLFWLHHCNVDRLLALWMAVHPRVVVTPGKQPGSTQSIPPGSTVDAKTSLTPFRNSAQTVSYHTSAHSYDMSRYGYSYEELDPHREPGDTTRQAIMKHVYDLYSGPPKRNAVVSGAAPVVRGVVDQGAGFVAQAAEAGENLLAAATGTERQESTLTEWGVHVQVKQFELNCSFTILIFLGHPPDDVAEWRASRNYVGSHFVFVNASGDCENCEDRRDDLTEGFVHLTEAVAKMSGVSSMEVDDVKPYLTSHLEWRVQAVDGSVVPTSQLSSLRVEAFSSPLTFPVGAIFPVPGKTTYHRGITTGHDGIFRHF